VCGVYWVVTWSLRVPKVSSKRWDGVSRTVVGAVAERLDLNTSSAGEMDRLREVEVLPERKRIHGCGAHPGKKVHADVGHFEFIMPSKAAGKRLGAWLVGDLRGAEGLAEPAACEGCLPAPAPAAWAVRRLLQQGNDILAKAELDSKKLPAVAEAVLAAEPELCGVHAGQVFKLKKKHRCIEG